MNFAELIAYETSHGMFNVPDNDLLETLTRGEELSSPPEPINATPPVYTSIYAGELDALNSVTPWVYPHTFFPDTYILSRH
jgi:hypothetical protein